MRGCLLLPDADICGEFIAGRGICLNREQRIARLCFQLVIPVAEHLRPDIQRDACGKKEQVCAGECAVSAQKDHQQTEYVNAEQNQARDAHFRRCQPAQHNRCKTEQNLEGTGGHRVIEDARTFRIALDRGERTGKECRAENHGAEDDAAPHIGAEAFVDCCHLQAVVFILCCNFG